MKLSYRQEYNLPLKYTKFLTDLHRKGLFGFSASLTCEKKTCHLLTAHIAKFMHVLHEYIILMYVLKANT